MHFTFKILLRNDLMVFSFSISGMSLPKQKYRKGLFVLRVESEKEKLQGGPVLFVVVVVSPGRKRLG